MSSCMVLLDNHHTYFYPGSTITGKVICTFRNSKRVGGIKVKLTGEEQNSWTKEENSSNSEGQSETRYVQYSGKNTFLQVENVLKGEGDISPGRWEYPFFFKLPSNIPGSFQGTYGGISFFIKAKVARPFWREYTDMKVINVFSPINFNNIRAQLNLKPVSYSDDKTICCWCCASGPITMVVHLEKEAFVPTETANVKVEITNLSKEFIEKVDVKLEMNIESKVTSPSKEKKHNTELLASSVDTGVGPHGERTYNFDLEIWQPAALPNFQNCKLFSQETKLIVTAVIPGCHTNLKISVPIKMGHIPISENPLSQSNQAQYYPSAYPPNPPSQGATPYPPIPFPNIPMPPIQGIAHQGHPMP